MTVLIVALAAALLISIIGFGLVKFSRDLRSTDRATLGHCIYCGYDLRGNRSGICPECGEPLQPN